MIGLENVFEREKIIVSLNGLEGKRIILFHIKVFKGRFLLCNTNKLLFYGGQA